jgi:hypothetical protein
VASSAGPDLEALSLDDGAPEPKPEQRPHPLGMRDVIDVLTQIARYAMVGGAVALFAVLGYLVGRASRPPVINRSPVSAAGVLWACGGRITGTAHLSGLPSEHLQLRLAGQVVGQGIVVSPNGLVDAAIDGEDPGPGPQLDLEVRARRGDVVVKTTMLRVPCR